jgi:hypothetical protein
MGKSLMETMTLRQWYAGQALTGLLTDNSNLLPGEKVKYAWHVADKMIAFEEEEEREREKRRPKRFDKRSEEIKAISLKRLARKLEKEGMLHIEALQKEINS